MKYTSVFIFVLQALIINRAAFAAPKSDLKNWMEKQEKLSWQWLQKNISPEEPKAPGEKPPVKGIVVGALSKKDPDYYFHWVRDSSHVMATVARALDLKRPYVDAKNTRAQLWDYVTVTDRLQHVSSPYSLGEPRYTV